MATIQQLIKALSEVSEIEERMYDIQGEVTEVDTADLTCTVQPIDEEQPPIFNVRLQSVEAPSTAVIMIPTVGADVMVSLINETTGYIIHASELEEIRVVIGDTNLTLKADEIDLALNNSKVNITASEIKIDADQITINGGSNDGLVKVADIVSEINDMKSTLTTFMTTFNTHTHVATSVGSPTAVPVPVATATFPTTVQATVENTSVKH